MQWSDPRLVSVLPFELLDFAELVKRRYILPSVTEAQHNNVMKHYDALSGVQVRRIIYQSDGLNITGAMLWPDHMTTGKHPLLIFNRGGSGPFGVLTASTMLALAQYAERGYIVFASNYRGNDGSDGKDEFGGRDVNDVLALLDLARSHPAWDGKNAFMYGHSRGGMMTYLAIKHGVEVNAAVATAAPARADHMDERPDMINVYRLYIPGYDADPKGTIAERSAAEWVEKLNIPLLLVHGDADDRVDVSHTLLLDERLTAAGKLHKMIIYPGSNHYMSGKRGEMLGEILGWFDGYKI